MAIPVTLQAILRTTSPTPTPGGVRALPRFTHRGSIKRRSCSITSAIITSSATHGTVGTHSLSTSWRHGPNTMTGMPSRLNGPGLIPKCADGSKNMLTEFLALLMSNSTSIPLRSDGSVVLVYLRLEAEIKTFELISERFRFLAEVLHGFCAPRYAHAKQAQRVCHRLEAGARNHRAQRLTWVFKI